jgi:hypothetical protein
VNQSFVDAMSLVHIGVGIGFGLFRVRLWQTLLIAIAWEVAEHVLKIHWPQMFMFPSQDTLTNATGDVLCAGLGWGLAGLINRSSARRNDRRRGRRTDP